MTKHLYGASAQGRRVSYAPEPERESAITDADSMRAQRFKNRKSSVLSVTYADGKEIDLSESYEVPQEVEEREAFCCMEWTHMPSDGEGSAVELDIQCLIFDKFGHCMRTVYFATPAYEEDPEMGERGIWHGG